MGKRRGTSFKVYENLSKEEIGMAFSDERILAQIFVKETKNNPAEIKKGALNRQSMTDSR